MSPEGKDFFEEQPLLFRCDKGIWEFLGAKGNMKRTDLDKIVYRAIEDNEDGLLFSQLLEVTKISKGSLNKPLDRLEDEGVIEQDIITKRYILKK